MSATTKIPTEISDIITDCSKGCYQAGLLAGRYCWSGAGLQGAARAFSGHYARSRANLVDRISRALPGGWDAESQLVLADSVPRRWRRELVISTPEGDEVIW